MDAAKVTRPGLLDPGEFASSTAGQIIIGGVAGALLGAAISAKLTLAVLLVGGVLAAVAVAAALIHPGRVFVVLVIAMALIPTYAAPSPGPILFIPAAGLSWVLVGVLGWRNAMQRGRLFKPNGIDVLAVTLFVLLYISLSFSEQVDKNAYLNIVFAWAGPYLAARLLLQDTRRPAFLVAVSFAAATVLLAPVALLETLGVENPFLNFQFNGAESTVWAAPASRLGEIRAEASFGHPIAFSMFASASALLSLGMAIYNNKAKERLIWLALCAVALGVQTLTYSRTGWVMLVFGVVLLAVTTAVRAAKRRLAWIFTVVGVALLALMLSGNAPKELEIIPTQGSGQEAENFRDSGGYREALLERATEPGVLGLWGNPYNKVTSAVSDTNVATDNAYIILADSWGLIPTFALIAIAAALLIAIAMARRREAEELVILPIAALTSLIGLFFVAFITQQQVMIWLLIGAASVGSEQAIAWRRRERPPSAQRLAARPERW